jgi:hypothetical protein
MPPARLLLLLAGLACLAAAAALVVKPLPPARVTSQPDGVGPPGGKVENQNPKVETNSRVEAGENGRKTSGF